jgi:methylenetetrahydrofolate dehydrogenase (NADP+)/methenyltetrahydrofolate cyclohydrolase
MYKILSGKDVAAALKEKLTDEVKELKQQGKTPGLCIVMAGDRPDSASYIKGAVKRCTDIGIDCQVEKLPEEISQDEFLKVLDRLNRDSKINGFIIMMPLPERISEDVVKYKIAPEKDVDCFNPINVSKVMSGDRDGFTPCTPQAVVEILDHYGIKIEGKRVVIIGRSMVVGRPLAMMLLKRNATVTICHTRTKDLAHEAKRAEILIAAAGKARMVTKDMVSDGAVVIDVGINFDENGKMCGDVDFDNVSPLAGQITPVPGGVGSVTSTVLAKQVIEAFKLQQGL